MPKCDKVTITLETLVARVDIRRAISVPVLSLPSQTITNELAEYIQRTKNVAIKPFQNTKIGILIEQDNWRLIAAREVREIEDTNLAISYCLLGWTVHGHVGTEAIPSDRITLAPVAHVTRKNHESYAEEYPENLDKLVRKFFVVDSLGVNPNIVTPEKNKNALNILNDTSRHLGGTWETELLWKKDPILRENGKETARRRLFSLERKLDGPNVRFSVLPGDESVHSR